MVANPSYAIYRSSVYGPKFGTGHDIRIANNATSNRNSYARIGHSYSVPRGVQNRYTVLAGTQPFTPDDWEVFYLSTEPPTKGANENKYILSELWYFLSQINEALTKQVKLLELDICVKLFAWSILFFQN